MFRLLIVFSGALLWFAWQGPPAYSQENGECVDCHDRTHAPPDGVRPPPIDVRLCDSSVHIEMGFSCTDCHTDIEELPHAESLAPVDCAVCHEEAAEALAASVHGHAFEGGAEDVPTCSDCHGSYDILAADDVDSLVSYRNVAALCGECHSDVSVHRYGVSSTNQEMLYKGSVHAQELEAGNTDAPNCINCHGYHDILPLRDPDSMTNFRHVSETCGQCHESEREQFELSVHGLSAKSGHKDAPVCTDCHGEHGVLRVTDEDSPVSFFNLSGNTCGRCHGSTVLNNKFGIPEGRVENFLDSYHGLALQRGSKRVANRGSCHGNHLILASSDPNSTVSHERLVETCGKCHPGISANVLAAAIHSDLTVRSDTIVAWVPRIYIPLILLTIGGMILHNGLIFWTLLREKFRREASSPSYRRFTTYEIIQHILLTVSFVSLVITGFALKYPEAWWVTLLSFLGMSEEVRMILHRSSGVLLIAISFLYGLYLVLLPRGRSEFRAFMPRMDDARHVFEHLEYHLGRRSQPPRFDRYDYTEKLEFWALVWGVVIMVVTGLILWFPIMAFQYLPKWAIDIAQQIHYYEAVLATLAIIVWHMFFVMFHPEEYPMSVTWLTGKMAKEDLKHRHPLEHDRLLEKEAETSKDT